MKKHAARCFAFAAFVNRVNFCYNRASKLNRSMAGKRPREPYQGDADTMCKMMRVLNAGQRVPTRGTSLIATVIENVDTTIALEKPSPEARQLSDAYLRRVQVQMSSARLEAELAEQAPFGDCAEDRGVPITDASEQEELANAYADASEQALAHAKMCELQYPNLRRQYANTSSPSIEKYTTWPRDCEFGTLCGNAMIALTDEQQSAFDLTGLGAVSSIVNSMRTNRTWRAKGLFCSEARRTMHVRGWALVDDNVPIFSGTEPGNDFGCAFALFAPCADESPFAMIVAHKAANVVFHQFVHARPLPRKPLVAGPLDNTRTLVTSVSDKPSRTQFRIDQFFTATDRA